ncbi:MAG: type IV pili methyl-accepting chemotaxis transducer N-terminal domain-containing protein [Gammaproteobacteria bacterium]|nr:type IV pili methyl-accepting chemotaxis transducer N-terminal domain-containing protein [Gammaproteobacteria bacterium]
MRRPTDFRGLLVGNALKFFVAVAGFVSLVVVIITFLFAWFMNQFNSENLGYIAEQKLLSQRITTTAVEAASGNSAAFERLEKYRDRFQETLNIIRNGNPETGLPAFPETPEKDLENMVNKWEQDFLLNINVIISNRDSVKNVAARVTEVTKALKEIESIVESSAGDLVQDANNMQTLYMASRQSLFVERAQSNLNLILNGNQEAATAVEQFGRDFDFFGRVLDGLLHGSQELNIPRVKSDRAVTKLVQAQKIVTSVEGAVATIVTQAPLLSEVKDAAGDIQLTSPELLEAAVRLEKAINELDDQNGGTIVVGILAALITVFSAGLLTVLQFRDARYRAAESQEINRRNQEAILRLLDEMTHLAEGDLTAHATVTEDITGAIADSINFSIDALRSLVEAIHNTVARVSQATRQTQNIANRLTDASQQQTSEITTTTNAISRMAKTMEQVSKNALNSSEVALKSVEIAHKGAETVRRNIEGMDSIRETIQETSKRIKRLGESSQQIGEIVLLITDIADRTNILALNAAIQASSAGDAGRGFAVVADEVQRLAERASAATKQISVLVETIQADTNEAVSSMEQSTAGVVTGAKLAEDAGAALNEIESVSKQLADLIQGISRQASEQAGNAIEISQSMNVIQNITKETYEGTGEASQSVGNLTELANELRQSVSGFKLPESGDVTTVAIN